MVSPVKNGDLVSFVFTSEFFHSKHESAPSVFNSKSIIQNKRTAKADSVLGKFRYLMYEVKENGGLKASVYKVLK